MGIYTSIERTIMSGSSPEITFTSNAVSSFNKELTALSDGLDKLNGKKVTLQITTNIKQMGNIDLLPVPELSVSASYLTTAAGLLSNASASLSGSAGQLETLISEKGKTPASLSGESNDGNNIANSRTVGNSRIGSYTKVLESIGVDPTNKSTDIYDVIDKDRDQQASDKKEKDKKEQTKTGLENFGEAAGAIGTIIAAAGSLGVITAVPAAIAGGVIATVGAGAKMVANDVGSSENVGGAVGSSYDFYSSMIKSYLALEPIIQMDIASGIGLSQINSQNAAAVDNGIPQQAGRAQIYKNKADAAQNSGGKDAAGDDSAIAPPYVQAYVQSICDYIMGSGEDSIAAANESMADLLAADKELNKSFEGAGEKLGQSFAAGVAAGSEGLIGNPVKPGSGQGEGNAPGEAYGLSYVPYDNFPVLLHEGERVLTAGENRNYNTGGPAVMVSGNSFTVREEADIEKIARAIARQMSRAYAVAI